MEASPLHATAVSPRQKAVCIIMGCHLIRAPPGGAGEGGGAFVCAGARGREVIGVQSLAQIVFYRLSHLAFKVPAAGDLEGDRAARSASSFGLLARFSRNRIVAVLTIDAT